jgi:predicted nucleotidyltransferase
MRLTPQQIEALREAIMEITPEAVSIRLFGSRLDDNALGGDIDLLINFNHPIEHPAILSARLAVKASRAVDNRKVDIVLSAPNLTQSAIHRIALEEGKLL